MTPVYTATDYEPVNPGLYTAKLVEINEASGERGLYYRWKFVVEDEGKFKAREVYANVSDKFGPKSKARQWAEQMIGRPIKKGERFDTDVLLGKSYHITVGNTKEDERGRVYDHVENVHRLRPKAQEAERSTTEPEDPDEEDFQNVPF